MPRVNAAEAECKIQISEDLRCAFRAAAQEHAASADFEEIEAAALAVASEMTRDCLERELQARADELASRVRIDGIEYRRHAMGRGRYYSLCGALSIDRWTYRRVGKIKKRRYTGYRGQAKTIVPLELESGIVEAATPALAYSISLGYAEGPTRAYVEAMAAAKREVPPRATTERIAKKIAGVAKQELPRIEPCLRQSETVPDGVHAISVGLDRTSVPMIEERPPGEPPNSPRRRRKRRYQRKPPPPFNVNYRMGYVGTISFIGGDGEAVLTRRYAATAEEGPDELLDRLLADVRRAYEQRPELSLCLVQDGAPELWNVLRAALRARSISTWYEVIDRYHVNERIAAALTMVESNAEERKERYSAWQAALDRRQRANEEITGWLRSQRGRVCKSNRDKFREHVCYLEDERISYSKLKRLGLPIGSGATEGACKSLYAARVKRSGQRWYQDGLTGVLTLRAMHQSDRLQRYWRHLRLRYRATVQPCM